MSGARLFRLARFGVAFAIIVYLVRSGSITAAGLAELAYAWPVTTAALLLVLVDVVVTSWRLCVLLRPHGFVLPLESSVGLTLIANLFSTCLPGALGGDLVRMYYASAGNHGRRAELGTIILLDRVIGLFAMVLFPILVAPFFPAALAASRVLRQLVIVSGLISLGMLVATVAACWARGRHPSAVAWLVSRLPLGRHLETVIETIYEYRRRLGALVSSVLISILAHALSVGVIILLALPAGKAGWALALVVPLGFMANNIPLTPGGIGVGEAAFDRLFSLAGFAGGAQALVAWRVVMLMVGALGLVAYLRGKRRFVHQAAAPELM